MDGAISKRKYPSYTTAQLESFVADIKADETGSDACMRMIAMQDEVDRRKSGESQVLVIPQLPQSREIVIGTQYTNRNGRICTVSDIWKTFNAAGEVVQTRYVATHEFMGQMVTERDILAVAIQRRKTA